MEHEVAEKVEQAIINCGFQDTFRYKGLSFSKSKWKYVIELSADNLSADFEYAKKELVDELKIKSDNVELKIYKNKANILPEEISECVLRKMRESSAFAPFTRDASVYIEGTDINIDFAVAFAPECAKMFNIVADVETELKNEYGIDFHIKTMQVSKTAKPIIRNIEEPKRETIKRQPVYNNIPKPEQPQRRSRTSGVFVKKIDEEPIKMIDAEPNTDIVVQGEVICKESRLSKSGKVFLIHFSVTDRTNTLPCFLMVSPKLAEEIDEKINPGAALKVKGKIEIDERSQKELLKVEKLQQTELKKRCDIAERKRVELHLHTFMSTQDGVASAKDYIKRASEWGHRAIAITDHGVVQAFPEAAGAGSKYGVKILFGTEAYMLDDENLVYNGRKDYTFADEFVVFDIETTGLSRDKCEITEIGAVKIKNGEVIDRFSSFVDPKVHIPEDITKLTGITDEMVKGAPDTEAVLKSFADFVGDACIVAHNASFDMGFIREKGKKFGLAFANDVLDTLAVARILLPELKKHKLNILADYFGIPLQHHRAVNDAEATAQILLRFFGILKERGAETIGYMNSMHTQDKNAKQYHTIILAQNKKGLVNLYKLISLGHLEYFYRKPRIPKSKIKELREGLIIGSACEQGELFRAVLEDEPEDKIEKIAGFYDYLEVQPHGNNEFLIRTGKLNSINDLDEIVRKIYKLGKKLGKPVVATTDCHFLDPEDEYFRRIVMHSLKFSDADNQAPLYFKTTDEMLEQFTFLGREAAEEIVIDNPNMIADSIDEIELFPHETAMPVIDGSDEQIRKLTYDTAYEKYGNPLPEFVEKRIERELLPIIKHGFSVLYLIAQKLVWKSNSDGYLVGSRGSVGSSLVAHMMGITEVNPLPPHYICPNCKHLDTDVDLGKYDMGVDMPDKLCPVCGTMYKRDGYNIPFEVFLGIDADKVPDIDLNFSGEYQSKAHDYVEELFGSDNVFRAGTISAIKDKTAFGYVKKYSEEKALNLSDAEMDRLARGISGVKRTTGQHPGGMVIVPRDREIYEFTAIQKPADSLDSKTVTTHFDFNSMHDVLVKLDILGHDNPTAIKMIEDITGMDPLKIPLDDKETMELFRSTKSLGITPDMISGTKVGTLGIPEFGTSFVRQMLCETLPTTMSELVRIAGLSHGTDVWIGNAQDLIKQGITTLNSAICTRDDIMTYLIYKGVEERTAFFIMESVRKGKWAKHAEKKQEEYESIMREAGVEEWFIESCRKIMYMFPKAHAVAYVVMSFRIAYCKVHYPEAFYATSFTIHADEFDANYFLGGMQKIRDNMTAIKAKGKDATDVEKNIFGLLELAEEMYARGIEFLPVDLEKSDAKKFKVEGNKIRLPFIAIPKLGEKAAENLTLAIKDGFSSIEDIKNAGKISNSVVEEMRKMGCFEGVPESNQLTFFDI